MTENKQIRKEVKLFKLSKCRSVRGLSPEQVRVLRGLERLADKSCLSEEEIEEFAIMLGRKINKAAARRLKIS